MVLMMPPAGARDPKKGKPAKIKTIADLSGHRVGIVAGSEGGPDVLSLVLRHYGVPPEKVKVVDVELKDLKAGIRDDLFDAVLVCGPATGKVVSEAVAAASYRKDGPTFIEIEQAEGIARALPRLRLRRHRGGCVRRLAADAVRQPDDPHIPRVHHRSQIVQRR